MYKLLALVIFAASNLTAGANPLVTEGRCSRLVMSTQGHLETSIVKFDLRHRTLSIAETQTSKPAIFPLTEIRSDREQTQLVALKDDRSTSGILKKYVLTLNADSASLIDATFNSGDGTSKHSASVHRHDLICLR